MDSRKKAALITAAVAVILAANLCVLRWRPRRLAPFGAALFAALLLQLAVPPGAFLAALLVGVVLHAVVAVVAFGGG